MLRELRSLLAAVPGAVPYATYEQAVVDENVLDKATAATRTKTLLHLRHLYALRDDVPLFAALRELWTRGEASQPQIALLSAVARDPLLRATADYILETPVGTPVTPVTLGAEVEDAFPHRYKPGTIHHIGQNTGSSWNQAGYLEGRIRKYRTHPRPSQMALVFALYLGHLEGKAGPSLFTTLWVRILEADEYWLRDAAADAGRAGWIDYASSGGMLDIGFRHLDDLVRAAA